MKSRFYTAIKIDINCDYVIKKESLNKWDDKAVTGWGRWREVVCGLNSEWVPLAGQF